MSDVKVKPEAEWWLLNSDGPEELPPMVIQGRRAAIDATVKSLGASGLCVHDICEQATKVRRVLEEGLQWGDMMALHGSEMSTWGPKYTATLTRVRGPGE